MESKTKHAERRSLGREVAKDTLVGLEKPSTLKDGVLNLRGLIDNPVWSLRTLDFAIFPPNWRKSVEALALAYWKFGRPSRDVPKLSTVVAAMTKLVRPIEHLDHYGLKSFKEVRPIHVSSFVKWLHTTPIVAANRKGQHRTSGGKFSSLSGISLAWDMREHISDHLTFAPFAGRGAAGIASGHSKRGPRKCETRALTSEQAARVFSECENVIAGAEEVLPVYEACVRWKLENEDRTISRSTNSARFYRFASRAGIKDVGQVLSTTLLIRDACITELALLVGLRMHETALLPTQCYKKTLKSGAVLGWLCGETMKGKKDGAAPMEWIAPDRVADLVAILQRIRQPLASKLSAQIQSLESLRDRGDVGALSKPATIELEAARRALGKLVLVESRHHERSDWFSVAQPTSGLLQLAIRRIGRRAGIVGQMSQQVLRRTFATLVVHECGGDLRHLRSHFGHWSIETTQLYAASPKRDDDLLELIGKELHDFKADVIQEWLTPGVKLSGQGGKYIVSARDSQVFEGSYVKNIRALASLVADDLVIRPAAAGTWCLSGLAPTCGGRGLYDARVCVECDSAVVIEANKSVWESIGHQMNAVLSLHEDDPHIRNVATRSLKGINDILAPFGVRIDERTSGLSNG